MESGVWAWSATGRCEVRGRIDTRLYFPRLGFAILYRSQIDQASFCRLALHCSSRTAADGSFLVPRLFALCRWEKRTRPVGLMQGLPCRGRGSRRFTQGSLSSGIELAWSDEMGVRHNASFVVPARVRYASRPASPSACPVHRFSCRPTNHPHQQPQRKYYTSCSLTGPFIQTATSLCPPPLHTFHLVCRLSALPAPPISSCAGI
jgi:hypothetical protein